MIDWRIKVAAILHDPVTKAFGLVGHERKAEELMERIGLKWEELDKNVISEADRTASAADRIPLYKGKGTGKDLPSIEWRGREDVSLYHPLSSKPLLYDGLEITDLSNVGKTISIESKPALSSAVELIRNREDLDGEISNKLVQKYSDLSGNSGEELYRKLFLWLWRRFDTLHGQAGFQGFILSWLPADTRIPDHSIYDHLITTSVFVIPNPCLLAFDIGGVGEFISQSRKTRDLWASSYLVSLAALAGMIVVVKKLGPDSILFPDLRKHPLIDLYLYLEGVLTKEELFDLWGGGEGFVKALFVSSIPGTFTIVAPGDQARNITNEIKSAIEGFFNGILESLDRYLRAEVGGKLVFDHESGIPYPLNLRVAEVSFEDVNELERKTRSCGDDLDCIKRAIEDFIPEELRRVEMGSDGNEYDLVESMARLILVRNKLNGYSLKNTYLYPIAYRLLQLKMSSLKLLADFGYPEVKAEIKGLSVRRRCKLCGARNPVVLTDVVGGMPKDERGGWRSFLNKLEKSELRGFSLLLDQDEPLCPVCLAKRLLRSLIVEAWSLALGRDASEIDGKLSELGIRDQVKRMAAEIPTLDDVAAAPAKRFLKEGIDEGEEKSEEFLNALQNAVDSLILFYRALRREWEGSEKIRTLISELGSKYPILVERGFDDIARAELDEKLSDPLQIPGALLYEASWQEVRNVLNRALKDGEIDESSYTTWMKHFNELLELLGGGDRGYKGLRDHLSNYVAFVYFDGDQVGKWFTGVQLIEKDVKFSDRIHHKLVEHLESQDILRYMSDSYKLVTPSYHRTLSRIIRGLASEVYPHLVESLDGFVFYSGGDDLLAVVPAVGGSPFKLLTALHTAYNSDVIKIKEGFVLGMGSKATGSSGVVVAHRLIPMSITLRDVRGEEEVAKGDLELESGVLPRGRRDRSSITRVSRGMSEMRAILIGDLLRIRRDWKGILELSDGVFGRIKGRGNVRLSNSFLRDMLRYMDVFSMATDKLEDDPELLEGLLRRCADRNLIAPNETIKDKEVDEIVRLYMRVANLDKEAPIRSSPLYHAHLSLVLMSKEVI